MAGLLVYWGLAELILISWLLFVLYKIRRVSGHFVDWDWVMLAFLLAWMRFAFAFASPFLTFGGAINEWAIPVVSVASLLCFIVGFERIGSHFVGYGRK